MLHSLYYTVTKREGIDSSGKISDKCFYIPFLRLAVLSHFYSVLAVKDISEDSLALVGKFSLPV